MPLPLRDYRPVLLLRPTQFSLGMEQVKFKTRRLQSLSKRKLAAHLHQRPFPIVVSPQGESYIIDHHHLLYACWQIGVKAVEVEIKCDLSQTSLSYKKFWKTMVLSHWAYLYDQFGEGPRDPLYLALDIRGLADDPYRSLAWAVREKGAYENSMETFAEFEWANFFRQQRLLEAAGRDDFERAAAKAVKLAKDSAAKALPGYKGKREIPKLRIGSSLEVAA